ncbi:DUF488 domain-containing protein [Bradyrhizobium sp. WSM 1704]|uniref:DUF488 domain-containing protein n=1 Tax=Bradyrhizobium semiaridum TaxID=2821404 RepID=UPI001CE39D90|nr:DUF488 domain-containing protein [Bradyrhizobium semiaridum]
MNREIFTFGYEGLSVERFVARLRSAMIETVIDVRANPLSRKPGLSKRALAEHLSNAEIKYVHLVEMGCPKSVRDRYKADRDWTAYTRGFLDYIADQEEAVARVASIAEQSRSCLICFEADFNYCHRTFVARAAAPALNANVVHLTTIASIVDRIARVAA